MTAVPPMPEGFTDRAAWDAIHWRFCLSGEASILDHAVIGWQRENQERVTAAVAAAVPAGGARHEHPAPIPSMYPPTSNP